MKNPVPPVSQRQVTQDSTLPWINKEAIPVLRAQKAASDSRPLIATSTYASDGAGTYLTLWSDSIPTDRKWLVTAEVIGSGGSHHAGYLKQGLFVNVAGTASQVGATAAVVSIESDAACDAKFDLTGTTLSVQVRDEATTPMDWRANIWLTASEE